MKKIILFSILTVLTFGVFAQQYIMTSKGYTINGEISKGVGYVTLRTFLRDGNEKLDSVWMDKKGRFVLRGYTQEAVPALLNINGKKFYRLYLEPSMDMKLKINPKKGKFEVKNAPLTDKWYSIVNPVGIEDNEVYLARLENWAVNNPEDIFSPDIMSSYLAYRWDYDNLYKHLNVLKGQATKCYHYFHLRKREEQLSKIATGEKAPAIANKDINGRMSDLNKMIRKNKYTLIDFWASWCAECRENSQRVAAIYESYNPKGFDIYSVSLDDNANDWKKAVKEDNIPWTSVCDFKKWESQSVKDYMIKSIPDNVLVDNTGTIVARNLDADGLRIKLAELMDYEGYTITGTIKDINEGVVTLSLLLENGVKQTFTTRVKNNSFTFSGNVAKTCMGMIELPMKDGIISFFMANDNITITGEKKKLENVSIVGSPSQNDFQNIANNCNRQKNPMQCLSDYVRTHPNSIYSPFIISSYLYPYMSDEDRDLAVNSLKGEACTMYQYYLLKQQAKQDAQNRDEQTDKAKDFILKNIKGQDVTLYSLLVDNDYTLVLFWASWDNISRNRNLDYLRLYNNYKNKNNFGIISVSLDDSKIQWENAVKADGLDKWENVSDLKRWSSSVVRLYNLNSIPSNMLLDKQGNILGRNLNLDGIINIITNK